MVVFFDRVNYLFRIMIKMPFQAVTP